MPFALSHPHSPPGLLALAMGLQQENNLRLRTGAHRVKPYSQGISQLLAALAETGEARAMALRQAGALAPEPATTSLVCGRHFFIISAEMAADELLHALNLEQRTALQESVERLQQGTLAPPPGRLPVQAHAMAMPAVAERDQAPI